MANRIRPEKFKPLTDLSITDEDKIRLDQLLVLNGLVRSRTHAKDLILRGQVICDQEVAKKANRLVSTKSELKVINLSKEWVSRGGFKLVGAIEHFKIELKNKICLDIGASTGGFTHVLLRGGVQKVYAVDVGRFQLAGEVKSDPRVVNLENTDARSLNNRIILNPVDLIVCDVSFISVKKVLLPCMALSKTGGQLLCLFKPQFEVGPGKLKKTGVLTDVDLRIKLLRQMESWFLNFKDWKFKGSMQSSLPGREGNKEFFILAERL
jgi:23S rRNA (cytidine1920-2'-O)/16S rRNA (cytidine1409-2'-O)-methyltransferase